jgi:membrane protein implicated in regulation of membrane protease activity
VFANNRSTAGWLTIALMLCTLSLLFQLFPSLWFNAISIIDVRTWAWRTWAVYCAFLLALLLLVYVREQRDA